MRLKKNRLQACLHRKAVFKKDREGCGTVEYGSASEFMAEVWPAGGRLQTEMYGNRLNYMKNVRLDGAYKVLNKGGVLAYVVNGAEIVENDGICIYSTEDPDYRIVSIKPYRYLQLEVERL